MARGVADTEMVRRQNRELVLGVLRREGAMSRTQIAARTGLSNASLTAIASELVAQGILIELEDADPNNKGRGRPAIKVGHNREAAHVIAIELDVNRCRLSLLDYAGTLRDRFEATITPDVFAENAPAHYLIERIRVMCDRNPDAAPALRNISISVQGILAPNGKGMRWSPLQHLAQHNLIGPIQDQFGVPAQLFKRGRLMAEGVRWLRPNDGHLTIATIYVGSTIGMGLGFSTRAGAEDDLGTEFGHMPHIVDGALCRCGARGCIEAYASDYGILRSAYSVPDHAPPATAVPEADFQQIVVRAHAGDRNAIHAFQRAGAAIGHGIARLMSIIDLDRLVLLGPTVSAFGLMQQGMRDGVSASLMGRINGLPEIDLIHDAAEPIFKGLTMKALTEIDRNIFAVRAGTGPEPELASEPQDTLASRSTQ
ncbi:ROK family transcriptional regulator [Pelagibacterium lentulum]|uniref:Transcriptional regulator n=1 Tax=Pelagibacterium lentulum TaxID=2029865 RepID=A0A916W205_9HYPH|nr:ROK family transcriptional regulator [Pelagibacterium lentulum]GGA61082.1 transcriptional regulator [Pelagibacterium lentulum]